MELLPAFPDAELIALDLLSPAAPTRLATPETLTFPLVIVNRVAGFDDALTDTIAIQVDAFGSNRRQAVDVAEHCRQLILAAPATEVRGVSIDNAWTEAAPAFVAYDDRNTQRFVGTYRIAMRRAR